MNKVEFGEFFVNQILKEKDTDFEFTFEDSCGNSWTVSGCCISMGEIVDALDAFDDAICG